MLAGIINTQHTYTRQMFWEEAEALEQGEQQASIKQAIWNAALSAAFDLETNCRLAELMRLFVKEGLPTDKQVLVDLLVNIHGQAGRKTYAAAIYRAQELEDAGLLDQFIEFPDDLPGQRTWRDNLFALMTGYGMAWKTCSMVALILFPTRSHLVPVDRHVLERFGYADNGSPSSKKKYEEIEDMVLDEREEVALVVEAERVNGLESHWLTWMWRREENAKGKVLKGEDHLRLNCRQYYVPSSLQ